GSDVSLSKAVRANLLSLQNTASMMDKTQNRLATGNKVNSALDNPSSFFTASALNSRAADMSNLLDSMASGIKVIEAANNGITALTKNLESMQSTLRQARQDKSFSTKSFEVTDASVINLVGGQFGDESKSLKLADAVKTAGVKSELTTTATTAYIGPSAVAASGSGATAIEAQGIGARTVVSNNEANVAADKFAVGAKFTVAGQEVTVSAITNTAIANDIQTKLDSVDSTKNKYKVTADGANGFTIETLDPTAEAAKVEFAAADQAQKASTSFNYSAVPDSMTVGGQTIETGATFEDFVANLEKGQKDGKYTYTADKASGNITITASEYGAPAPVTSIPTNVVGVKQVDTLTITGPATAAGNITVGGIQITVANGATAANIGDSVRAFFADPSNNSQAVQDFRAMYDLGGTGATVTFTAKTPAAPATPVTYVAAATGVAGTSTATTAGVAAVDGRTDVAAVLGASTKTVAAATDEFSVSYDGKTANISITGVKGGGVATNEVDVSKWQAATITSVNAQLEKAGIKGVEASFDTNGKFSLVAKEAEAKTLAITGTDAVSLFGSDAVSTGSKEVSALNATKTVDKFVELINREHGGKVRASNDNGKLRIENMSTQELDIGVDTNGNGAVNALKVEGNSVRTNLSKQFNELRDQLDKLSDDASFNGINLLRGDKLKITFNESGTSSIDIQAKDKNGNVRGINASNLSIESLVAEDLDTDEAIDSFLGKLSSALTELRSQASAFGSNLSSVENRQSFTKNMINTLETGAANLTLADTNAEAANLLALQTRQQLSSSALSMASQQDQAVLQLLR
ncbi:flagellin, partial [Devosia sp. Leaf64]|uniref:flagellin N-terminal helical domain-containing protein n=1 Tax=Devosia sp. Leaf64 TaxID=1736229 RepID=UPI001AEBBDF4